MKKLLVTAALVLAPITLSGWAYYGHRWATNEVRYYINPSNQDGVTPEDAIAAIRAGIEVWFTETGANLQFIYMGETSSVRPTRNGRNEVVFSQDILENNFNIGQSMMNWDSTGFLSEVDIVLYDGRYQFFGGDTGCVDGYYIQDIVAHEAGHLIGLAHSDVPTATMVAGASVCSTWKRSLDPDDIEGARAVYSVFSPPPPPEEPPPPPAGVTLTVRTFKVKGVQHLEAVWAGTTASFVNIYQDGVLVATVVNDGREAWSLGRKGGGSYRVQVCGAGTADCSPVVVAAF